MSLVHPVVTSPPVAHLACATGIEAGAAGAPRKIDHDRAHHDWPVSRIRAGKTMLVGDLEDRFGQLHVHPQPDGGRRLELRGELDLTAAKALRTPLPDQLTGSGPVTLDPDGVNYLSCAGVGLLIDAAEHAEAHHVALQLQLAADSLVARLLTLTGLDTASPVTTGPVGPFAATVRADPLCAAAPRRAVAAIQATASSG